LAIDGRRFYDKGRPPRQIKQVPISRHKEIGSAALREVKKALVIDVPAHQWTSFL
jgi:hypothetical protein